MRLVLAILLAHFALASYAEVLSDPISPLGFGYVLEPNPLFSLPCYDLACLPNISDFSPNVNWPKTNEQLDIGWNEDGFDVNISVTLSF